MSVQFSEAFRLLWRHLGLFTAIILTVWLPGNILLNYVTYYVEAPSNTNVMTRVVKASMWIDGRRAEQEGASNGGQAVADVGVADVPPSTS